MPIIKYTPWPCLQPVRLLLTTLFLCLFVTNISAQEEVVETFAREYTAEQPLVYEDANDLWPYAYLNEHGEPEGFNIDLIKKLMRELKIPYIIRLTSQQQALQDLKDGKSDLTFGLAAGFHDEYGKYGRNAITLFTQSVATPKSKQVEIKSFRDLSKPGIQVIVRDSSLCHHLMLDYGWTEHAIASQDISEAIQHIGTTEEGQIVWNTLSLKWLIQHYNINNVELTPVNMPHGDYRFMSNDQHLLDVLDDAYVYLDMDEQLTELQNKWFYPDYEPEHVPYWEWYVLAIALMLLGIATFYILSYRRQNRRVSRANKKLNRRLALIIETSKVRIWTYRVDRHEFVWHKDNGEEAYTYTEEEFSKRYSPEDFEQLKDAIQRISTQHKDTHGHEEDNLTIELKAKDVEGGDNELHDFVINISVLQRDKDGKPTVIIGTKKDVTEKRTLKQLEEERTLRFWSIFYSDDAAILYFDKDGFIHNANHKAGRLFHCESDELIRKHVHINDFFRTSYISLLDADGHQDTMTAGPNKLEYQMRTVLNDDGDLLGVFVFCHELLSETEQ